MNTLNQTHLFISFILILIFALSCSQTMSEIDINNAETALFSSQFDKRVGDAVQKPFTARFITTGGIQPGLESEERCGLPPLFYNVQDGEGQATHLGKFDIRITFCVDATDLLDDGMLTEGETLPYYSNENTEGYMVTANGDYLYIDIPEGYIMPSEVEGYDFMFMDQFNFTDGSGRFEGASGTGMTNSLVNTDPEQTEHVWEGILVIPK